MTQIQLDSAVAAVLGESVCTVHHRGFSLLGEKPDDLEPEQFELVLDCPFCGRTVRFPGRAAGDAPAIAECLNCDTEFEFDASEVYTLPVPADAVFTRTPALKRA